MINMDIRDMKGRYTVESVECGNMLTACLSWLRCIAVDRGAS